MPGHRNPLGMSGLVDQIQDAVSKAKSNVHNVAEITKSFAQENNIHISYVDLIFQVSQACPGGPGFFPSVIPLRAVYWRD